MEKWRVASHSFQFNTLVAAIACVSSRHEFTRGGELIRAFLSLPSSHLCISVLPFLPLFFTVSRAISHFASFSLSFLGDNRSIVRSSDQQLEKKFFYRFVAISFHDYIFPPFFSFFNEEKFAKQGKCDAKNERRKKMRCLIGSIENRYREYRFFSRHKSPSIDVYFERYLKRLVRLVLLDQE